MIMPKKPAFSYTLIRKAHLKHLYLRIKEKQLIITANRRVSEASIHAFLEKKRAWIEKHLSIERKTPLLTDPDATLYFLGNSLPVSLQKDPYTTETVMKIEGGKCHFLYNHYPTEAQLKHARDIYYKKHCHEVITPLINQWAENMQLIPQKITYRHNKSRWGSCSSQNNLSLNTRLMMLPMSMIRYVVIHELAHIQYKNHSHDFWTLVESYCPNYKLLKEKIRLYELYL